jgi:hypothetical protein
MRGLLLVASIWAVAGTAQSAQTLVQHPNNFTCNSSTPGNLACAVTLTQSIGAGHVLLMLTASWLKGTTSTASYVSASSGDGSSWTQCPSAYHGSINFGSTQWMDTNCAYVLSSTGGGSATATITLSAPTGATTFSVDAEFLEIAPTAGSTAVLETQTTAYTTSSSCSPCVGPALSLAGSDDYVAQWIAQGDATTFSIGGAYTNPIDVDANDVDGAFAGALDQSSAGAQSWTVNAADMASMSAVAIRTTATSASYTASASEQFAVSDGVSAVMPNVHYIQLFWTDIVNPAGTVYRVYRALATTSPIQAGHWALDTFGACNRPTRFVAIAQVSALSYIDRAVTGASYCYALTALYQGMESALSSPVVATELDFGMRAAVQVQ